MNKRNEKSRKDVHKKGFSIVSVLYSVTIAAIITTGFVFWGYITGDYSYLSRIGFMIAIAAIVVFQAYVVFFTAYQTLVSVVGVIVQSIRARRTRFDEKQKYKPSKRFALIVCAHNEETVIGEIVNNLVTDMEYPKELYDVFVIADNCTDSTAAIVRQRGGIAMERHDMTKKGKGFGLEWMFSKLWEREKHGDRYDAVCIFDADNLVTTNFLTEMNASLLEGSEVVQAYLDSKNPRDSWVTRSYAAAYWTTNFIFQNIRNGMGLSAQLGGTGMCMTTKILKEIGWGTESLTEDLEFTAKYVSETGRPVSWCHTASVFDEKPLTFRPTWKQRIRWMVGHINCMIAQGPTLVKQSIKQRSLLHFDIAVYLAQPIRVTLVTFMLIPLLLSWTHSLPDELSPYILRDGAWSFLLIFQFIIPLFCFWAEKRKFAEYFYTIWSYFFGLTWMAVVVFAFFRRKQREWNPTKHTRVISIEEVTNISA